LPEVVDASFRRFFPSSPSSVHLLEPDVLGVLMEALTAHVEAVLTDETVTVAARSARARALAVLLGVRIPNVAETHFVKCLVFFSLNEIEKF